jgi:hypothetical protein
MTRSLTARLAPDHPSTMYPEWVAPFLASLRHQGVIAQAARDAGIGYSTAYALRERDADFAAAWTDALEESYDSLEAELLRRAVLGTAEPVVYQGQLTYELERDAAGNVVVEQYDTGTTDTDGDPVLAMRPKMMLDDKGRPVPLVVRKKSDALLMFALKGRRKKVYAERTELTGADGGPVELDDTARAARVAQLIALGQQRAEHGDIA